MSVGHTTEYMDSSIQDIVSIGAAAQMKYEVTHIQLFNDRVWKKTRRPSRLILKRQKMRYRKETKLEKETKRERAEL